MNTTEILIRYYSLMNSINDKESYILLDSSFHVIFSSNVFADLYNNSVDCINNDFFQLSYLREQSAKALQAIQKRLENCNQFIITTFTTSLNQESKITLKQLKFTRILIENELIWEVQLCSYSSLNLLSRYSEHYDSYINNDFLVRFKQRFSEFTDYQLAICYLMAHNFSNQKIADIINEASQQNKSRSRITINRKIDKIKKLLDIPSKEVFIECLHRVGIFNIFPQVLFKNRIIVH